MAITRSQRQTREWPLLVLAVALVAAACVPVWQWLEMHPDAAPGWSLQRVGRLLLGPEQIACYTCFVWACFILLSRFVEQRRQRQAFGFGFLPTEEGARILPEDARPLLRKVEQTMNARGGPSILGTMVKLALGKFAISKSSADASETVRIQADVDLGRLVSSMSTVHFLAWAIPAIGFLGTVRGLAQSLSMAGKTDQEIALFLEQATQHLNTAFDCTLVALALSVPLMFFIHSGQRDEEALVIDCQQYCLEHLINRLYDPEHLGEDHAGQPVRAVAVRAPR